MYLISIYIKKFTLKNVDFVCYYMYMYYSL